MKNKICYVLLCLLTSFSFMNYVFAEGELEFSVKASVVGGETTIASGGEATINVALNSNEYIPACTFEISSDSGIEIVDKAAMNNYTLSWGTKVTVDSSVEGNANFVSGQDLNVLQLKYKINSDGKVTIKTTDCTSVNDKTGSYQDISVEFKTKDFSDDTTLSSLTVFNGTMSPMFSSNVTDYVVQLSSTNFSLDMSATNPDFQDDIVVKDVNGNELNPSAITFNDPSGQGQMKIIITVNGKTNYNLLTKYSVSGLESDLEWLKVDGEEIELETGKYEYEITIENDVTSVKVEAALKDDSKYQFADFDGSTIFSTPNLSNTLPILIIPKDSSTTAGSVLYSISFVKECEGCTCTGTCDDEPDENVPTNPSTGGISTFLMTFILFASLIGSIVLYQKKLNNV